MHTYCLICTDFYALVQGNGYKPKVTEILSWTMRGLSSRWSDWGNIASCQLFSSFISRDRNRANKHSFNDGTLATLDNWQPVWNKQVLISTPVCLFVTAPWLWWYNTLLYCSKYTRIHSRRRFGHHHIYSRIDRMSINFIALSNWCGTPNCLCQRHGDAWYSRNCETRGIISWWHCVLRW